MHWVIKDLHYYLSPYICTCIFHDIIMNQAPTAYLWWGLLLLLRWTLFAVGRLCMLSMWMMVGMKNM